jgi:hypothetical protein
VSSNGKNFLF